MTSTDETGRKYTATKKAYKNCLLYTSDAADE